MQYILNGHLIEQQIMDHKAVKFARLNFILNFFHLASAINLAKLIRYVLHIDLNNVFLFTCIR